jgi:hypothetical protein
VAIVNLTARLSAGVVVAACAGAASADIVLLEHSRELFVRAEDPSAPLTQQVSASSSAGFFSDDISVFAGSHSGRAWMDSFMGTDMIRATAGVEGRGDLGFPMGQGMGEASLYARFEVMSPTPFRLSGFMETAGGDSGGGVSLRGPGGPVFDVVAWSSFSEPFDRSGTLDPGVYELVANVGASVFSPPGADGSFAVVLELPGPGAVVVLGAGLAMAACRRR